MSKNKLIELQRYGFYDNMDNIDELTKDSDDTDSTNFELIEQHCWIDLDEDGYEEPYIVTIHVASGQVFRITARYEERDIEFNDDGKIQKIFAMNYYTLYTFLPSLDGSIFGMGMGTLLAGMNKATNTALNALINAGHLATMQGGFLGKGLRIPKKDLQVDPGEWITASANDGSTLKDNIVPFNYKEPSQVLFQLVQYLVEASKTLSASTDVMTGTADTTNVSPNTLMSLIQQSLTTYVPIQRRLFRGLKEELRKLALLNQRYLDIVEYVDLIDPSDEEMSEMFDQRGNLIDYDLAQVDVVPVVDINESTRQESIMKTQALNAFFQPLIPTGTINVANFVTYTCRTLEIDPDIYKTFINEQAPPPPDAKLLEVQRKATRDQQEMELKKAEVINKGDLNQAKTEETKVKTVKLKSDVEVDQADSQLKVFDLAMKDKQHERDSEIKDRALKVQLAQSAMSMTSDSHKTGAQLAIAGVKKEEKDKKEGSKVIQKGEFSKEGLIKLAKSRGFKVFSPTMNKDEVIKIAKQRGFKLKGDE